MVLELNKQTNHLPKQETETLVGTLVGKDPLEKENCNSLQYPSLESLMDRGTLWVLVQFSSF